MSTAIDTTQAAEPQIEEEAAGPAGTPKLPPELDRIAEMLQEQTGTLLKILEGIELLTRCIAGLGYYLGVPTDAEAGDDAGDAAGEIPAAEAIAAEGA